MAKKVQSKGTGAIGWMLFGASLALAFIPIVGPALGHLVDRKKNGMEADAQKDALAQWYRQQVAAQLGMRPDQVTRRDLELAAQSNPTFKAMLDKVEKEENLNNRASAVGAAIATPMSAVGLGGAADAAGKLTFKAGEMAVAGGASVAAGMITKDVIMVDDMATLINQKREQGQAIDTADVFMLRLAHNKELQDQIKEKNGQRFHKMTKEQQFAVMSMMPEMSAAAEKEAYALNKGLISEQDLVVATGNAPAAGGFAGQVAQSKPASGSFRDKINAERAAAAGAQLQTA